jgi:hypothetical protein
MDGIVLTLLNTVVCLVLPKLLSIVFSSKKTQAAKTQVIKQEEKAVISISEPSPEVPSFL